MSLMLGADPELFLEDHNGKVISAIGRVGGTKKRPKPIKELGKKFSVQEDNVLLEYNIPPAKSGAEWVGHHTQMLEYLATFVDKMGLKLSDKASHSMDEDQLVNPSAHVFGCEPDFDVWALDWNKSPKAADPNLRSAGGHIHVGYENPDPHKTIKIARMCDLFIGAPLKLKDPDKKRAELYGRPGAIRFKPYGFEYRTPSNYWITKTDNISAVHHAIRNVMYYIDEYEKYEVYATQAKEFLAGKIDAWEFPNFLPETEYA
jgi:hypothetical protein